VALNIIPLLEDSASAITGPEETAVAVACLRTLKAPLKLAVGSILILTGNGKKPIMVVVESTKQFDITEYAPPSAWSCEGCR
tara:strand:+ start:265 stop:510 length:246 start_codon:yes stop_codon:yes gene_type:complete